MIIEIVLYFEHLYVRKKYFETKLLDYKPNLNMIPLLRDLLSSRNPFFHPFHLIETLSVRSLPQPPSTAVNNCVMFSMQFAVG